MAPTNASIRPYTPDDFDSVVRMLGELDPWRPLGYTRPDWERFFEMPLQGREAFVIELDGNVAGVGVLRQRFLFGDYLELLAVAASAQGRGHGGTLLGYLEDVVFRRSKNLFVCVSDFNHQGRRFYERHGYKEIGPILHLLVPESAEILMRKTSGPAKTL